MKHFLITLLLSNLFNISLFSQDNFDIKLSQLSDKLALKFLEKAKKKIAVWDFTDLDGNVTTLGKYISENLSVDLTNSQGNLQVVDRNNLNTILKEHQLKSEGYIDPNTAIQLGKIIQVGAIVTGKITVFSNGINLTMKILDSETGDIFAALSSDLPLNNKMKDILEIPYDAENNISKPSGEIGVKKSKDLHCKENNTGDYCFQNNTQFDLNVQIKQNNINIVGQCTLQPGQQQCFYDLISGKKDYYIFPQQSVNNSTHRNIPGGYTVSGGYTLGNHTSKEKTYNASGSVYVEQCKSKIFVIK